MRSPSITPQDARAGISRLTYGPQFDKYLYVSESDMKASFAECPPFVPYSEVPFSPSFSPETPTLSTPDTPTTAGLTSPSPTTPKTSHFGPPSPGYSYPKIEVGLGVPFPPKTPLLHSVSKLGAQRVGASVDLHDVCEDEGDEGQELIIPEPRSTLLSPLQLHLAPPRPSGPSPSRLKLQQSCTSMTSCISADIHQQNLDFHQTQVLNAYKSNVLSPSTTTLDESFDTDMFEILTPTQEAGTFNPLEPALPESASSILCPLPTEPSPQSVAGESPPASPMSDSPSLASSERPLIFRRHRPLPLSVSQDLNSLVRRFHVLDDFFSRRREGFTPVYDTPPHEISGNSDRVVSEGRMDDSGMTTFSSPSARPQPASSGLWFPPSGPDSPVRFFADSPAPLTPSPTPPGGFIRRYRPRSLRSISPMHLDDTLMAQGEKTLESTDSGLQGLQGRRESASELLFPMPPTRSRRQLAISVSFKALDDESGMDLHTSGRDSWSTSPRPWRHIDSMQTEYRRRPRLPDGEPRPKIIASAPGDVSESLEERGRDATQQTDGFWKALSTSASGLFVRKMPAKQVTSFFEAATPKKRILASLSGLFRRRARPGVSVTHESAHLEVWPSPRRRTSSCSDPTCLFHPQHPSKSLDAMSFAGPPASEPGDDAEDVETTFLAELGDWGIDGALSAWIFDTSPSESQSADVTELNPGVREEGEMLQHFIDASRGGGSRKPNSS